jgi:hypothetical protein
MKFRIEKKTPWVKCKVPADKYWEHKQNVLETIFKIGASFDAKRNQKVLRIFKSCLLMQTAI